MRRTSVPSQKRNPPEPSRLEDLQGQVERISYANDENGYTVARVKVYGRRDLVTAVGNLMAPTPGEILKMKGVWSNHPKYGEQFKVTTYETAVPASVYGIRKYLGSGLIKGVGPVIAERIVSKFGKETLDVIEADVEHLTAVEGIGKKRISMIKKAWAEQKEIREVMLFLQSHGVSSAYAAKIFKAYGAEAVALVEENPYRLATDIYGIGFITADRIAGKLGIEKDAPIRIQAGVLYVLNQLADEGHVYYPYEPLLEKCGEILETGKDLVAEAVAAISMEKAVVIEDLNEDLEHYQPNNKAVYLARFHLCETRIARRLTQIRMIPKASQFIDADAAVKWVQGRMAVTLAENQVRAVKMAVQSKVMVITGGPGTGKTTIIRAIIRIFSKADLKTLLAAPTGRAAKRLSEASGRPAKTIHRLLEYSVSLNGFQRNHDNPLDGDLLVVDEASMIDTVLMHHLLKAVPGGATLILAGDVNQLPSVGAGNVLKDIIESGVCPVASLTEIFRQAKTSRIIVNAHKINSGVIPRADPYDADADFFFIRRDDPEKAAALIVNLVKERIPRRFGFDPVDDIQVLTPMHRGAAGAGALNDALQAALNPHGEKLARGNRTFRAGDKVMQIRNNYEKEVFNGDIGRIRRVDQESREVVISFDGREVDYDYADLDEIALAYAVSVHKAQGSEYAAVVMPVLTQHYVLLQRNLLYTAVTRGRKLVVMAGSMKALAIAVKNNKTRRRFTMLKERLRNEAAGAGGDAAMQMALPFERERADIC